MPFIAKILIIIGICLVVLVTFLIFLSQIIIKSRNNKMYREIDELFNSLKTERPDVKVEKMHSLDKKNSKIYDYTVTTPNSVNFIKIIPNFSGDEITINNSVKWQLRRSYRDESMRFVRDIEGFMRYEKPEPVLKDDAMPVLETKRKKNKPKEENLFTLDNLSFSDLDINKDSNKTEKKKFKKNRKLFVIYPGTKALLMFINECEMQLVDNKTFRGRKPRFGFLSKSSEL